MSNGIVEIRVVPNQFKIFQIVSFQKTEDYLPEDRISEDLLYSVEVENFEEKTNILKALLSSCNIPETNCYIFNENVVIRLLKTWKAKEGSIGSVQEIAKECKETVVPDGLYFLARKVRGFGIVRGEMEVRNGRYIVKEQSTCAPFTEGYTNKKVEKLREKYMNSFNMIKMDCECDSLSTAATLLVGKSTGGYSAWETADGVRVGDLINHFKQKKKEDSTNLEQEDHQAKIELEQLDI